MKAFIRKQTGERLEKLDHEFRSLAESPTDADAIHHVRVAIRRLTQCLRLFEDCFDADAAAKLHRRSHRLLKRCGAVRDCDIALQLVEDPQLKKAIGAQRKAALRKLSERVDRLQHKRAWKDWTKRLHVTSGCGESPTDMAHRLLPKMMKAWRTAGDAALKSHSPKSLHRFRLLGKRLRYTLELFTDVDPRLEALLEKLRTVQDQLGAINDCATALPLVQGHPAAEVALTRLLHSRERQFRQSWAREREKGTPWKSIFSDTAKPSPEAKPVQKTKSPTKTAN
jgi:CHAD domain-containing protein